jgi:hypothetical protein
MEMHLRRRGLIAGIAIFCLALTACAPKLIPAGWVNMARHEISFGASRTVVPIPPSAPAVKRLLIAARMNGVDITQVRVLFENGTTFERPDRTKLEAERDTVILDLPGDRRKVREVVVLYFKLNNAARRAVIEVWGDPR